ncbi:MAG: hypothetical protein ACXABY_07105 [Candidatus Thorarchaeota archaeon]|jgi:hypothetical protein
MATRSGPKKRAMKRAAKQYIGKKGKASKYTMKQKDATTTFGYAKQKTGTGRYKKQPPTTKTGRKSLKRK